MRNISEDERDKIMAQFQSEMDLLMSRQEDQKQTQRDKVVSKLAARKRLRSHAKHNGTFQPMVSFVMSMR